MRECRTMLRSIHTSIMRTRQTDVCERNAAVRMGGEHEAHPVAGIERSGGTYRGAQISGVEATRYTAREQDADGGENEGYFARQ